MQFSAVKRIARVVISGYMFSQLVSDRMDYYKLAYFLILFYSFKVRCEEDKVQCEVRARIESGWICGKRRAADNGAEYASFRGIPYARQPVGPLRFQELRPVIPWDHYLDATEEKPACPQHDEVFGRLIRPLQGMSEACIYANVHVPLDKSKIEHDKEKTYTSHSYVEESESEYTHNEEEKRSLPIMVYIHGGSFRSGSGDSDLYGPEYLVSRGVIVITFNYRLNVFGFLYLNSPEVPGNQGLRDQLTLLRWVRRNARAFGGDPDNVTLMGQSAGAACAHLLSLSKEANGLFRRVILSSGTANRGFYTASPLYSKAVAALFLSQLGINSTDPVDIHNQLVSMPLNRILLANSQLQYLTALVTFTPVIETAFPGVTRILDDDPTELVKRGRGSQYPLMVGFNTAECAFFRPVVEYFDVKSRIEANPILLLSPSIVFDTPPNVSLQLARQAMRKYFRRRFTYEEFERSCTETLFQYPMFQLANLRASMKTAPVFMYQFAYESQVNFVQKSAWIRHNGTGHIEDFVRIFKPNAFSEEIGVKRLPARDEQIKDWMTKFVVNFMRCSNPTCSSSEAGSSPWPAVQQELRNYQHIEEPGVYRNRAPTRHQWGFIQFNEYVEAQSRRAISEQGALREATPSGDDVMAAINSQLIFKRPTYPLAILYKPRVQKKYRLQHVQGVTVL